jgi:type IV fimbrial biogenesis protein FimT
MFLNGGPRPVGRTLIELVIALAIGAALVSLALPSYHQWIARAEQSNAAHALMQALNVARSEAIRRGQRVDVCASGDGMTCSGTGRWGDGWITFVDLDDSGDRIPGEWQVAVEPAMPPRVSITGNKPVSRYVSYTDLGHARLTSGALQMGTFDVCRSGQTLIQVVLANSGRARIQQTKIPCP